MAYNHIVRSWLFGAIVAARIPKLQTIDKEVHAVAAILHDLGWDKTGTLVSPDKRFEVDGAEAARAFLEKDTAKDGGEVWDARRLQLVWDAIALHTTPSIGLFKEPEVVATFMGVSLDFGGPNTPHMAGLLSWDEYEAVVKAFPRLGFKDGVREILCGFCRDKPVTTYDNFMQGFGERFVEGYKKELDGKKFVDWIEMGTLE